MPTPLEVIITVILHPLHYKYQNTILIKFYYTCYSKVPTIRMNPLITPLHFLSYSLYLTPFILLLYLIPLSYPFILPLYLTPLSYSLIIPLSYPFILLPLSYPIYLTLLSYPFILPLYLISLSYPFILYIYLTPLSYPLILLPLSYPFYLIPLSYLLILLPLILSPYLTPFILLPQLCHSREEVFNRELSLLCRYKHDNIIKLIGADKVEVISR